MLDGRMVTYGFRRRLLELAWSTADNLRSRIVVGVGIVDGGVQPLLVHCSWKPEQRSITATAAKCRQQQNDNEKVQSLVHLTMPLLLAGRKRSVPDRQPRLERVGSIGSG